MGTEHEDQVRAWGFEHVFTWTDGPRYHYAPHSHVSLTTHFIVEGEMTVWYPNQEDNEMKTYGPGERVDVDAGRVHEVLTGDDGCTYVIGEDDY